MLSSESFLIFRVSQYYNFLETSFLENKLVYIITLIVFIFRSFTFFYYNDHWMIRSQTEDGRETIFWKINQRANFDERKKEDIFL